MRVIPAAECSIAGMNCLFRGNVREIMSAPGGRDAMERALATNLEIATREGHPPRPPAIEFARIVLVNKDFDQGYELLADGGKRHISSAKFKETMIRLHPRGFPTTVTAKEYQVMPGENALWIYLNGQNPEMHYRLTMEATPSGDYKVLTIDSGAVGRMFSSASDKNELSKVFSTPQ